jgi:hypothetical protein
MLDQRHRFEFSRAPWRLFALGGVLALFVWRYVIPRALRTATQPPDVASADKTRQLSPKTAFEPTDWSLGPVAWVYVGTAILLVVSSLVLIAAYPNALPDVGRTLRISPPGPRLQTSPEHDLQQFRAEEEKRLNTYYWIDKQKGTVHIPIDRAMEKIVQTGLPGFPKEQE